MKHILFSIILLLSLSGCQDTKEKQAKHDAKVAQQAREELLAEFKAKEEAKKAEQNDTKLSRIGITMDDGKITIDTNKTKEFFQDMTKKLSDKIKKMTKELQEGTIENKDAGIELNESHINIDLNKTKDFVDDWGKRMQGLVKEFDEIVKGIENHEKN